MLYIGKLDEHDLKLVDSALPAPLKADTQARWRTAGENIAAIDNLKLSSLCLFDEHVEQLLTLHSSKIDKTSRFPNLPQWEYCFWLPLKSPTPWTPPMDSEDWPFSVGSAISLLHELNEIRELSSMELGAIPEYYELMRTDIQRFYSSKVTLADDKTVLQWVWRSFFDAATLSIERDAPIVGDLS